MKWRSLIPSQSPSEHIMTPHYLSHFLVQVPFMQTEGIGASLDGVKTNKGFSDLWIEWNRQTNTGQKTRYTSKFNIRTRENMVGSALNCSAQIDFVTNTTPGPINTPPVPRFKPKPSSNKSIILINSGLGYTGFPTYRTQKIPTPNLSPIYAIAIVVYVMVEVIERPDGPIIWKRWRIKT